jgi:serine/threonine-protein kinase RsbW
MTDASADVDGVTPLADRTVPEAVAAPSIGQVDMAFPVENDLLVLARLAVSTVAARAGFDVEEIEDLRLAVDELCLLVVAGRRLGRLLLSMAAGPDRIDVWCHYEGNDEPESLANEELDLSGRILEALVDEHGPHSRHGLSGQHLCKRRLSTDG